MATISPFLFNPTTPLPFPQRFQVSFFQRAARIPVRCQSGPPPQTDSDGPKKSSLLGFSTNIWRAGLGSLGFVETGYLTYLKVTNSEVFCPVGGGSCSDVLNSDYASVFGVPLPVIGMFTYGLVAFSALQQTRKHTFFGVGETDLRLILLVTTTSMASASAYFLYLLSTKLAGASCSYCLMSAILSFSLFFITLKEFGFEEIQKVAGIQLAIAGLVVASLSNSYMTAMPQISSTSDITLEPYETEIIDKSTPLTISLAKHLHSIGSKMYGAFWCTHCLEQKQMFGHEAAKILDYVECFPNGVGKGRKISPECAIAGVEGFPTWIIKDKVLSGEQELSALAEASGFVLQDSNPS